MGLTEAQTEVCLHFAKFCLQRLFTTFVYIRYLHDLIMPEDEYSPLKELVLDSKLEVVRALSDLCHSDR